MRSLLIALAICIAASSSIVAQAHATPVTPVQDQIPAISTGHDSEVLISSSARSIRQRETAGPDTFYIYGGPGSLDGKFQDAFGLPDWQGWTPRDLTDQPTYWQLSTFNAENLNSHGPGNLAYWCGQDASQVAGWYHTPGYGNNWNDILLYESSPVVDPSVGETVSLDFYFHHDSEPGYDYLWVEYDSAGTWTSLLQIDASNKDTANTFQAPGVQFSAVKNGHGIVYSGNDFGGDSGDQIRIRLRFSSDGAWSDEDGFWVTTAGAVQVDDISLTSSNASFLQDHDTVADQFVPDKAPFAGDFADIYPLFTDLDPCFNNNTPVLGFIDYGQHVRNGPGVTGMVNTGGSTSSTWTYGVAGGYVVNYTDGISGGGIPLANEVWSPPVSWDPGVAITDPEEVIGLDFRFDVYRHLDLINGMFHVWHIRSRQAGGDWSNWQDRNFVYYGAVSWLTFDKEVTDLLVTNPAEIQMALGVVDFAGVFGFPGNDASPSPVFDNVSLKRYRVGGPVISTRQIDLSNDGFPPVGTLDVSTQAGRDALDIPFDMARDVNTGNITVTPGDSIYADITSRIPGATLTDSRMIWALKTNSVFEDAIRSAPARSKDQSVVAGPAGTVWSGQVIADTVKTTSGTVIADRYFFDLPDVDLMYPGDELHYYIQATDSDGRITTFPNDLSGFGLFDRTYNRAFRNLGLPSIADVVGNHPRVLVWNDFGHRGGENDFLASLGHLGMAEGVDYDTYTTNGPSSGVSNGLGSAGGHGASQVQVAGYSTILYFAGDLTAITISDGQGWGGSDKSNDLSLLTAWNALPGDRHIAYFGDGVASNVAGMGSNGSSYVQNNMGVVVNDSSVRDEIDNQTAPVVRPLHAAFTTEYVAYGGCALINNFDSVQPTATAVAGHGYVDLANGVYAGPQASIVHDRLSGVDRKVDVLFPYSMMFIYNKTSRTAASSPARTKVFEELFGLFGVFGGSPLTGAPEFTRAELSANPNPFNPSTTVKFANVVGQKGSIKVFNLRGELVTTLHNGEFITETFQWDGRDRRGASVASGVYVIQAKAGTQQLNQKVALVK